MSLSLTTLLSASTSTLHTSMWSFSAACVHVDILCMNAIDVYQMTRFHCAYMSSTHYIHVCTVRKLLLLTGRMLTGFCPVSCYQVITGHRTKPGQLITGHRTKPGQLITGHRTKPGQLITGHRTKPSQLITGHRTTYVQSKEAISFPIMYLTI